MGSALESKSPNETFQPLNDGSPTRSPSNRSRRRNTGCLPVMQSHIISPGQSGRMSSAQRSTARCSRFPEISRLHPTQSRIAGSHRRWNRTSRSREVSTGAPSDGHTQRDAWKPLQAGCHGQYNCHVMASTSVIITSNALRGKNIQLAITETIQDSRF